ncbi:MAG: Hsp20/alpha crystallin family protein [Phycisphaerales bacterium]|nr:MAG: Hsp20/alpha crystallin family protein [Phycisphaerales bacterium]
MPRASFWSSGLSPVSRMLDLWEGDDWRGHVRRFDVDVREDEEQYVIEADLPGVERENVEITLEDGVLTIEAKHGSDAEDKCEGYCVRERRFGSFARSFRVPNEVDADNIKADLKNGVLSVTLPKSERAKVKKVQVKEE